MKYYRDEGCWVQAPATHFVQLTELKVGELLISSPFCWYHAMGSGGSHPERSV